MKRFFLNLLLVVWLGCLAIDQMPSTCYFHSQLKPRLSLMLNVLGLNQGTWQLFCPNVRKFNYQLSAEIEWEDGTLQYWASPDYALMPPREKFLKFREMAYFENVHLDFNEAAWPALADYLKRTLAFSGVSARRIVLFRHWSKVALPFEKEEQGCYAYYLEEGEKDGKPF